MNGEITITYKGNDYALTLETVGVSIHNANDDRIILQAVGDHLQADLTRGYQVLRSDNAINITPFATYG